MELSAVIFPDTMLSERMCIPLVPVFFPLVYLQPVENEPSPGHVRGALRVDELLRQSFCRVEIPAPLGEDRERFLQLVRDICNRRDDYAAQLGHQTLAGISSASRKETKSSIVSSLLAGHGIREEAGSLRNLLLWQSRLLLKLAEMHAADQAELRRQVQSIREKEQGLFAGLREEEENPFGLPSDLATLGTDTSAIRRQRTAWARLLIMGNAVASGISIYVSSDRDGVELLCEVYEKVTGKSPVELGQLTLPAAYPKHDNFLDQVRGFREEGAALLARVQEWLGAPTGAGPLSGCFSEGQQRAWSDLLERFFPAAECGRASLTLCACSGRSARQLFAEAFAPEERGFLTAMDTETGTGVVLGVLEQGAGDWQ